MRRTIKIILAIVGLILLTTGAFGVGVAAGSTNLLTSCIVRTEEQPPQFSLFWQAWNTVQQNFVDRPALDPTQLTYGAIRGMVAGQQYAPSGLGASGHLVNPGD